MKDAETRKEIKEIYFRVKNYLCFTGKRNDSQMYYMVSLFIRR